MVPKAQRVFLIVRGPAPSCRIVGVVPFRARKGENSLDFAGRVRGRLLERGVYLLTISSTRRLRDGAPTEYARVASPRRTVPLPDNARKPTCSTEQTLAADSTARFLGSEPATTAQAQAGPTAPLRPPLQVGRPGTPDESDDPFGPIPSPGEIGTAARESAGEALATITVLIVVGLLFVAMLGFAARFMRGTWNP